VRAQKGIHTRKVLKGKRNSHAGWRSRSNYYTWNSNFSGNSRVAPYAESPSSERCATVATYRLQRAIDITKTLWIYCSKTEYVRRSPVFSITSVWTPGEKDRKSSSASAVTT
jgi:hypothetical protein